MTLWVFGDSYSHPGVAVDPQHSYWGLAARYLNVDRIVNCSRSSNSFGSVQHLLVGLQQQYNWDQDVFLIGVPPLERITVFDNHANTEYQGFDIDPKTWNVNHFGIENHRGLICLQNFGEDRTFITHSDRAWTETQALRDIFLLTQWLDSKQAQYVIINHSKPFDHNNIWGPSEFLLSYCQQNKNCILFDHTYHSVNQNINKPEDYDAYGWYGHHGAAGNQHFFDVSLLPTLERIL